MNTLIRTRTIRVRLASSIFLHAAPPETAMLSPARLPTMRCASPPGIRCGMNIDARPTTIAAAAGDNGGAAAAMTAGGISLAEWQGWGTSSPVPSMVVDVIEELRMLEKDLDSKMSFGGLGGKLQGDFRIQEDKKHRAKYQSLNDSEEKLQFFAARQIACRLLGSRGHLCQRCWLALEDCMCSKLKPSSLWHGIRFWLYMHPKDFLRQNNTGKLLWQVFGVQAATLCLFGIHEHEDIMWNIFKRSGKHKVWCLYPKSNSFTTSIPNIDCHSSSVFDDQSLNLDGHLNFVLIDGTWNNSAAMFRRLEAYAKIFWGQEEIPCISLATQSASVMHKLRPQPSWDRTCTAAAAMHLLLELHLRPEFSLHGLDKQAEAVENGLEVLFEALTGRRRRMGRSTSRRERHNNIKIIA